ncbi:hypothetical protein V8C44DRAFT_319949 [Trichoderma aethiopicum]
MDPILTGENCRAHDAPPKIRMCQVGLGGSSLLSTWLAYHVCAAEERATLLLCAYFMRLGAVTTGCLSRTTAGLGSCEHLRPCFGLTPCVRMFVVPSLVSF